MIVNKHHSYHSIRHKSPENPLAFISATTKASPITNVVVVDDKVDDDGDCPTCHEYPDSLRCPNCYKIIKDLPENLELLSDKEIYLLLEDPDFKDHQKDIVECGIEPLVSGINIFDGVDVIESCEGHYDQNDPAYDTDWQCCAYIVFTVDSMKNLNIFSSSIEKNIKIMWNYFKLFNHEDWSTKAWFEKKWINANV